MLTPAEIRRFRLDRGLSQQAFADDIGVTVDVVRSIETGRRPTPANALKVATYFRSTPSEFFPASGERAAA